MILDSEYILSVAVNSVATAHEPAVIYEPSGRVAYANDPWKQLFGQDHAVGVFLPHISASYAEIATLVQRRGAVVTAEIDAGRAGFGYIETHSIPYFVEQTLLYILTVCTEPPHRPDIELAYARQISPPGDNLFILREDLSIVTCEVDSDSLFYGADATDRQLLEAIHEDDANVLLRAMRISQQHPTTPTRIELRIHRRRGLVRMASAVTYVPGRAQRWILSTRSTSPLGGRIIARMCEAWGVDSYAALARAMDIDRSTISKYRTRDSVPSGWLIETYLKHRVSVHWLYTGHGPKIIADP